MQTKTFVDLVGNRIVVTDEPVTIGDDVVMVTDNQLLCSGNGVFIKAKVHRHYKNGTRCEVFYHGTRGTWDIQDVLKVYKCNKCGSLKGVQYQEEYQVHYCPRCQEDITSSVPEGYREDHTVEEAFEDLRKKLHLTHKQMWRRFPCFAKEIEKEQIRNLGVHYSKFLNLYMMSNRQPKEEENV